MLILYEMLLTSSIMHTQRRCKFENTKHRCLGMFLHKCDLHLQWQKLLLEGNFVKSYHTFTEFNLPFVHRILFWIDELIHFYSIFMSSTKCEMSSIKFHWWYENSRRHFQMYHQWKCLNFDYNFTEVCSQGSKWLYVSTGSGNGLAPNRREAITRIDADPVPPTHIYGTRGGGGGGGGGDKITKLGIFFNGVFSTSFSVCFTSLEFI